MNYVELLFGKTDVKFNAKKGFEDDFLKRVCWLQEHGLTSLQNIISLSNGYLSQSGQFFVMPMTAERPHYI